MKATISVIIPVYNVEKYLRGCLDSLQAQTFTDYEAICVNDGSKDGSLAILEEYAAKDARIQIISQANKGLSGARNTGMDRAQGEYLFFLDSDDYIHPQALEFLHRCAVEHDVELVAGGYKGNPELYSPIDAELEYQDIQQDVYTQPLLDYFREYKSKLPGMVWTKLYKQTIVGDIRFIEGRLYEDEYFTALVMERCQRLVRLEFDMYNYYYGRNDAITTKANAKVLESHLANIRFLCEHFTYDRELLSVIKKGKVSGILFGSCLKAFPYIEREVYASLKNYFINYVAQILSDGIINYRDFSIINQYKLYRIINGHIPSFSIIRSSAMFKLCKYMRNQLMGK